MSEIVQGLMACLIGGFFFLCIISTMIVVAGCVLSGRISRDEADNVGAPEGALIPFRNTRLNSQGSKLSFQASHNPSRGGN